MDKVVETVKYAWVEQIKRSLRYPKCVVCGGNKVDRSIVGL